MGPRRLLRFVAPRALRAAAAVLAAAAAAGPKLPFVGGAVTRVVLLDVSASVDPAARAALDPAELGRGLGAADRLVLVRFAEHAAAADSDARGPLPPHATSLAAALRLATELTRDRDGPVEIVLASDLRATDAAAEVDAAALALRRAGGAELRVRRLASRETPPHVAWLTGPGAARAGEPFALQAGGVAARGSRVELVREGAVVEVREIGEGGAFRVAFARIEDAPGLVVHEARVASPAAQPAAEARVVVTQPGRPLVLTGEAGLRGALSDAFPTRPGALRADAPGLGAAELAARLAAHDLVVVDGVDDALLPERVVDALESYVRSGGGLVLGGGPDAFGGSWAGRPVERISPLRGRPPDAPGPFLYVALDASGSMAQPWPGAGAPRDEVVRDAAARLVSGAGEGTHVALRRFAAALLPEGTPARVERLDAEGRERLLAALRSGPEPGGATALLPALEEAARLVAARPGAPAAVLLLTDGRTAEPPGVLRAALVALAGAGARVTLVVPPGGETGPLRAAAEGVAGTSVVEAGRAESLGALFHEVEERARVADPLLGARRLRATPSATGLLPAVPRRAERLNRAFAAPDATVLVETDSGEPVAAVGRYGLGRVAAVAARLGDAGWIPDGAAPFAAAVGAAVARPPARRVRIERRGPTRLLVSFVTAPGEAAPSRVVLLGKDPASPLADSGLRPAAGGLHEADFAEGALDRALVARILSSEGAGLAEAGIDRPAPLELRGAEPVDVGRLRELMRPPTAPPGRPLRPWLAAAAVGLLVASSVRWRRGPSIREGARDQVERARRPM